MRIQLICPQHKTLYYINSLYLLWFSHIKASLFIIRETYLSRFYYSYDMRGREKQKRLSLLSWCGVVCVSREAARECRRKKKEYIKCLENRVAVLENQNKALIDELKSLKELYCQQKVEWTPYSLFPLPKVSRGRWRRRRREWALRSHNELWLAGASRGWSLIKPH